MSHQKEGIDKMPKKRFGIILGQNIDESAIPPLRYIILHLNCLQTYFEYEFLPFFEDPLILELSQKKILNRQHVSELLPDFLVRYEEFLNQQRKTYKLLDSEPLPDSYIFIGLTRFHDEYYLSGNKRFGIIALGNWKRVMAPPSLLEFILTMVLIESIYLLELKMRVSHLGTKGCLFDFNVELSDARYQTLQSFLCHSCMEGLKTAGHDNLAVQIVKILNKEWLGIASNPLSPAGIISNFRYDLFLAKGLTPTFWEKASEIFKSEGLKELLKLIAAIILAAALFYLGWKK